MRLLSQSSMRNKLMLVLLLTSGVTLIFSTVGFAVSDWFSLRGSINERLQAQAEIVGNNSVAALSFEDTDAARETLSSLKGQADIVAAALYSATGKLFATYQRSHEVVPFELPKAFQGNLNGDQYVVYPINLDDDHLGSILLISDFSYWDERQAEHMEVVLGVFVISLILALFLSARLQNLVSKPILQLAETARKVSETQDFQLRARKYSDDEIGTLAEDFNEMLQRVERREMELFDIKDKLEEKVRLRTLELTELTQQLEHQAYHDTLTGLANRVTFDDHLKLAIDQARRHRHQLAVMFLDLDRFKMINDSLGHGIGDQLLQKISHRLSDSLRDSDTLARLGGDEFAVLLPQTSKDLAAADVAAKLIQAVAKPVQIEGYSLHVTTSIGISLFPNDGEYAETIVKNADTAMYRSKDRGRNQVTFFSAEMNSRLERRLVLESLLRKAIEEKQLTVYYQPRFNTFDMQVIGYEALARWEDDEVGTISPSEFIPLAEECGLISQIDEWVLETACREMKPVLEGSAKDVRLAVNFSPAQFVREDLDHVIADILSRTGFSGNHLELEITESLFGPGREEASIILKNLQQFGVEISIDDFGTAYSSLSRLKQLPLHTLKIDRSFIKDLGVDSDDEVLVKTIITLAHSLGLKVVAEGIETDRQYSFVKQYGCDIVQGFYFGKPMPIAHYLTTR